VEGHITIVDALLVRGAMIEQQATDGENTLILSCKRGHDKVVDKLLENGADINGKARDRSYGQADVVTKR